MLEDTAPHSFRLKATVNSSNLLTAYMYNLIALYAWFLIQGMAFINSWYMITDWYLYDLPHWIMVVFNVAYLAMDNSNKEFFSYIRYVVLLLLAFVASTGFSMLFTIFINVFLLSEAVEPEFKWDLFKAAIEQSSPFIINFLQPIAFYYYARVAYESL